MNDSTPVFTRDRLTWLAYFMLAYIGFSQGLTGPLMPSLRAELGLSYTQGGLIPAGIACGLILTGLFGGWLARHINRAVLFWGGGLGLALSVFGLGLSHQFGVLLLAVLGIGIGGSLAQVMVQALLSDRHAEKRAIALTESNVAASLSGTITPLVLGSLQGAGLDWRLITGLGILLIGLLFAFFHNQPIPNSAPAPGLQTTAHKGSLPFSFWLVWTALLFMVAFEMSIATWATDFFINVAHLNRANAVLAFGAFPAAMLTGRLAGSRLTRRIPSSTLLFAAILLTLVGFPMFWLGRLPVLNILGLFLTGLGVANQYPLTMSIAVGLAKEKTDQASARVTLAVGTALLVTPLVLGWLADHFGLQNAFGLLVLLMVAALAIIVLTIRWLQGGTLSMQNRAS